MPLFVVPMAFSPLSSSMKESISFSSGVTMVHLPSTTRFGLVPLALDHLDLLLQRLGVDGDSRPDEEPLSLQEAGGKEVEDVGLLPDHYRVTGVAPAVVSDYRMKPVSVVVYYLPFAFVSPLETDDAKVPQTAPSSPSRI